MQKLTKAERQAKLLAAFRARRIYGGQFLRPAKRADKEAAPKQPELRTE